MGLIVLDHPSTDSAQRLVPVNWGFKSHLGVQAYEVVYMMVLPTILPHLATILWTLSWLIIVQRLPLPILTVTMIRKVSESKAEKGKRNCSKSSHHMAILL